MKYPAPPKGAKKASRAASKHPKTLEVGYCRQELVALCRSKGLDSIDAIILDKLIWFQNWAHGRDEYIEEERERLARQGIDLPLKALHGWFWKSADQLSFETQLFLHKTNMGHRLSRLAEKDLIDQRDPEPGTGHTTKFYRVSVVKIDRLLQNLGMGYRLQGYLILDVLGPQNGEFDFSLPGSESQHSSSESLLNGSESLRASSDSPTHHKNKSKEKTKEQHQQPAPARGKNDVDVVNVETEKNSAKSATSRARKKPPTPPKPAAKSKAETPPLPSTGATATPPTKNVPGGRAALLARLAAVEADEELRETVAAIEADLGAPWTEIAPGLVDSWDEATLSPAQLVKRLTQGYGKLGLDSPLKGQWPKNTAETDLEKLRWHVAVFRFRGEPGNPGFFITRVTTDQLLEPQDLWRMVAPLREARQAARASREHEAARGAQEAEIAAQSAQKAAQEQEAANLDAIWENLDDKSRERIENDAKDRLGVLGRMGRAQAGLVAMRRNLLREMLEKTRNGREKAA